MSLATLASIDRDIAQPLSRVLSDAFAGAANDAASLIYVSPDGNDTDGDGSIINPLHTITAALAACTAARKTILVLPGEYSEVDIAWPNLSGIELRGLGGMDGVAIVQTTKAATAVITMEPTATASWSATIANISIESDYTAGKCLYISNANVSANKKMNIYLDNVNMSNKNVTDTALSVSNTLTSGAIRVYCTGNYPTWEGLVLFVAANASDRLRVYNHRIIGAITMSGAVAAEATFISSAIPTVTVNGANALNNINCWHESDADPDVYTAYTNAYDT